MLEEHQDEVDGKQHGISSLQKLKHRFRRVLPGHQSHSARKDSQRDSAVSTSSEMSEFEGGPEVTSLSYCERRFMSVSSDCLERSDKQPANGTIVHIVSPHLRLLRVSDTCLGEDDKGNPIYKVDCNGEVGKENTNLVFYFLCDTSCDDCKQCYLHVLDPKESSAEGPREDIPLAKYTYRLCLFEKDGTCFLAAHKAECAACPFDPRADPNALVDVCYHPSKGGKVTLQANSDPGHPLYGMLWAARVDGEVWLFRQNKFHGWCTNPFTLFSMYDEVPDADTQRDEAKRANGEV